MKYQNSNGYFLTTTMVKTLVTIVFALMFTFVSATEQTYSSLEEFCLGMQADSAENCACGQETANNIMTDEEQAITLAMMQGDPNAAIAISGSQDVYREKIAQVTSGCND